MSASATFENEYKVRLQVATNYANMSKDVKELRERSVTFQVSPDVTENRTVTYKTLDPLHMPGQILVYGGTSSRTFQLSNIRLVARTVKEATDNMRTLHMLRSWTMPYFGNSSTLHPRQLENRAAGVQSSGNQSAANTKVQGEHPTGMELLGAPPDVLILSAYSPRGNFATSGENTSRKRLHATNIHNVPVVITNLTIPYSSDVDYIPTIDNQPMPRMMIIDIQLTETHSPQEYNSFSLQDFRNGVLKNF
jgi:hypothetical protein